MSNNLWEGAMAAYVVEAWYITLTSKDSHWLTLVTSEEIYVIRFTFPWGIITGSEVGELYDKILGYVKQSPNQSPPLTEVGRILSDVGAVIEEERAIPA